MKMIKKKKVSNEHNEYEDDGLVFLVDFFV